MRTAWHCGNVAPMRADAALARLRDVSHRSASHRCSARRNAPSRSPTLPTRRDLDVEPLRLETGEAAGDGLEPLADDGLAQRTEKDVFPAIDLDDAIFVYG